jgi:hypothetical protein
MAKKPSQKFLVNLMANPRFGLMPVPKQRQVGSAWESIKAESQGYTMTPSGEWVKTKEFTEAEKQAIKRGGLKEWQRKFAVQVGADGEWVRKADLKDSISIGKNERVPREWFEALPDEEKTELKTLGLKGFTNKYYISIGDDSVRKDWYESLLESEQKELKSQGLKKWQENNTKKYLGDLPDISNVVSELILDFDPATRKQYDDLKVALSVPDVPEANKAEIRRMLDTIEKNSRYIRLSTGEYARSSDWDNLTLEGKALLYKYGMDNNAILQIARQNVMIALKEPMALYLYGARTPDEITNRLAGEKDVEPYYVAVGYPLYSYLHGPELLGVLSPEVLRKLKEEVSSRPENLPSVGWAPFDMDRFYRIMERQAEAFKIAERAFNGIVEKNIAPLIKLANPGISSSELNDLLEKEKEALRHHWEVSYDPRDFVPDKVTGKLPAFKCPEVELSISKKPTFDKLVTFMPTSFYMKDKVSPADENEIDLARRYVATSLFTTSIPDLLTLRGIPDRRSVATFLGEGDPKKAQAEQVLDKLIDRHIAPIIKRQNPKISKEQLGKLVSDEKNAILDIVFLGDELTWTPQTKEMITEIVEKSPERDILPRYKIYRKNSGIFPIGSNLGSGVGI